jgi:hypothetical protein
MDAARRGDNGYEKAFRAKLKQSCGLVLDGARISINPVLTDLVYCSLLFKNEKDVCGVLAADSEKVLLGLAEQQAAFRCQYIEA